MEKQPLSLTVLNLVMAVSITPLWLAGGHFWREASHNTSQGAGIPMAFMLLVAYIFVLLAGGVSAIWSLRISHRIKQPAGFVTGALRLAVLLSLLMPWLAAAILAG